MAPPSAVIVPNVVIGAVFAVGQRNDLALHGLSLRKLSPIRKKIRREATKLKRHDSRRLLTFNPRGAIRLP
jgi:hypothetical protein